MLECVGIYCLTCLVNGKRYVGSAFRCRLRGLTHFGKLTKGIHVNRYLQAAWNKYGAGQFTFSIIEECDRSELKVREQWWINKLQSNDRRYGYNLTAAIRQDTPAEGISQIHKDYWANLPEEEQARRHAHKRTEAGRALLKQNADRLWANSEYRALMTAKVSATMTELCKDPEIIRLRTESSRNYWAKPDSRAKMSKRVLDQWAKLTPEQRSQRSHIKPRETTRFVTLKGVTKPLKEWSSLSGLPYGLLLTRLNNDCPIEKLFLPSYKYQVTDEFAKKWL